ncbi:MAG: SusD/RagB family nutrient-binding outer membrane lipoprotein [Ferruginibacter sp.]
MKYNLLSKIMLGTATCLVAATGCKKLEDFGNTNVNPNGSLAPITAALLTSAEVSLGGLIAGTGTGGVRAGLYVQYFSETQYTEASLYAEPKVDFNAWYTGPMQDLQVIINQNTDAATKVTAGASGSNGNQIAIATILRSYYIWTVTDRWGDVPYSEASGGAGNFTPTYDKQMDIYTKILADLKSSLTMFDAGVKMKGDIIYGGDQVKWKKLANTLRMLISLRMSKVYPNPGQLAATEFAAAEADVNGSLESAANNFTLPFPGGSYKNTWYGIYESRSDYGYSKTLSDILNNMNDNRKDAFGGTGSPFPYGLKREQATTLPTNYARVLSSANNAENAPLNVVNAASSLLARAEAVERGWIGTTRGTAKSLYDKGITESFAQWGLSGAATYIANGSANYTTGTGGGNNIGSNSFNSVVGQNAVTNTAIDRIFLQRYLAHYPDGIQGWSEWRRSCAVGQPSPATAAAGMPKLIPTAFATNSNGGIPRRFVYGTSEYSLNPTKLQEAVGRLTGGDVMTSRVWWDL